MKRSKAVLGLKHLNEFWLGQLGYDKTVKWSNF